jgi:capsular polysaccharide biosynthesis protein
MVEMTTATINGSRRIEAWGSSKNTKNKHRCKHICAVISLICGFALVILGILIVLFFRDLVDNIIKSEIPLKEGSKIIEV